MPKPQKWADFTLIRQEERTQKHGGYTDDVYAHFRCPYLCGIEIEMRAENVKNNKSTICGTHLEKCSGVDGDGNKAEDDPRVCEKRKAAALRSEHALSAKRGKTSSTDTTLALREENSSLRTQKDTLAVRNDDLQSQMGSLQAQMDAMRVDMERRDEDARRRDEEMRKELTLIKPLVPLMERISKELGISANVPPAAHVSVYVDKIEGLRKAAAVAGVVKDDKQISGLMEQIEVLKKHNTDLVRQLAKTQDVVAFWDLAVPLFKAPVDSTAFLKRVSVSVHPDKHQTHNPPTDHQLPSGRVTKIGRVFWVLSSVCKDYRARLGI